MSNPVPQAPHSGTLSDRSIEWLLRATGSIDAIDFRRVVTTLRLREREALDAHAASFGALAAISRLVTKDGDVDDYSTVIATVAALRAEVAALRAKCDALDDALADETGRARQEQNDG